VKVSCVAQEKAVRLASAIAFAASVAFAGAVFVAGFARRWWPSAEIAGVFCCAEDIEGTEGERGQVFGHEAVVGAAGSATAAGTLG
jgi:hypothetical protein